MLILLKINTCLFNKIDPKSGHEPKASLKIHPKACKKASACRQTFTAVGAEGDALGEKRACSGVCAS
jgi:hypothetical protein